MSRRAASPVRGLLPLAVLLVVWEVAGDATSPFFPTPATWAPALAALWSTGVLAPAIAETLRTLLLGFAVAVALGAVLGAVIGAIGAADRALNPSLEFARAIPPAAMVPIATLLLGFDETMKVTMVGLAAGWPVLLSTRTGMRTLHHTLLDTARTLRLGHADRVSKVVAPALLPSVLLGVRVAAPIAVAITLLVEILTQVGGVGALIAQAQRTFQPARVYVLILVAGVISLCVNTAVGALESRLSRHHTPA